MLPPAPGYDKGWLADGRVLCFRFRDLKPATVDGWARDLTAELTGWPDGQPWRLLLDIRLEGNTVNTYALRHARAIASLRPDLPGRLALLVASRLAADVVAIALRAASNRYRRRQVFVNETLALRWLLEDAV